MTLNELNAALQAADPSASVAILADGVAVSGGYHITELKRADVTSIDCGGRIARWREADLQILDGAGGDQMTVGTIRGVIGKSVQAVDGLGDAPLRAEFAAGNQGLRRYAVGAPEIGEDGAVALSLTEERAACKPMVDAFAKTGPECCEAPRRAGRC